MSDTSNDGPPYTLAQLKAERPLSPQPGFLQRSWTPAPAVQEVTTVNIHMAIKVSLGATI